MSDTGALVQAPVDKSSCTNYRITYPSQKRYDKRYKLLDLSWMIFQGGISVTSDANIANEWHEWLIDAQRST
jgi:hypothetical protein